MEKRILLKKKLLFKKAEENSGGIVDDITESVRKGQSIYFYLEKKLKC